MTAYILSHLHALPEEVEEPSSPPLTANPTITAPFTSSETSEALLTLAPELITRISSFLLVSDIFSLRLSCKYLALSLPLDQQFWREQLIRGALFGLWDFDRDLVGPELNGKDWKRLVRTLARYRNFEGPEGGKEERSELGEMSDAPLGLKNRRRIWKIVHEASA